MVRSIPKKNIWFEVRRLNSSSSICSFASILKELLFSFRQLVGFNCCLVLNSWVLWCFTEELTLLCSDDPKEMSRLLVFLIIVKTSNESKEETAQAYIYLQIGPV